MDLTLNTEKTSPPSRKLTLHLQRREGEAAVVVKGIEIFSDIARNKTTFKERYTLQDVFPRNVARVFGDMMRQLSGPVQTFSSPDFLLENGQSHLSGLYLVGHKMRDGIQNISIYFNDLIGSMHDFLAANFHEKMGFAPRAADLNASILGDIALPFLDLVGHVCTSRGQDAGPLDEFKQRLEENAHEAVFRVELLKRLQRSDFDGGVKHAPQPLSDELRPNRSTGSVVTGGLA